MVLENPMEGNAVYVIWDDWVELSRLTRQELLDKHRADITRIVHSRGWFGALQEEMRISRLVYQEQLRDNP